MPDAPTPGSWSSSSYGDEIGITLTPSFQNNYIIGTTVGYRLRVQAWEPVGMDDSVFRYYRKPANAQTGVVESVFSGVCSWPDMVELPQNEPEDDTSPTGFRLNYIDLVVSSQTVAQEVWELVQEEVQELVQTIKDGQNLDAQGPVRFSAT